jgi:WD40 repeat protein
MIKQTTVKRSRIQFTKKSRGSTLIKKIIYTVLFVALLSVLNCAGNKEAVKDQKKSLRERIAQVDDPALTQSIDTPAGVLSVSFSPDGKYITSGLKNNTVILWKTDGTLVKTLEGHTGWVNSVAFSPGGKYIVSGSKDNTIKVWKTDGTLVKTLEGHSSYVNSVAFSPDGRYLVSGSYDGSVKIWKDKAALVKTLEGHSSYVNSVAFSLDGKYIVSGSNDRTINLWKLMVRQ